MNLLFVVIYNQDAGGQAGRAATMSVLNSTVLTNLFDHCDNNVSAAAAALCQAVSRGVGQR